MRLFELLSIPMGPLSPPARPCSGAVRLRGGKLFRPLKLAPKCDKCALITPLPIRRWPGRFRHPAAGCVVLRSPLWTELTYEPPFWVHLVIFLPDHHCCLTAASLKAAWSPRNITQAEEGPGEVTDCSPSPTQPCSSPARAGRPLMSASASGSCSGCSGKRSACADCGQARRPGTESRRAKNGRRSSRTITSTASRLARRFRPCERTPCSALGTGAEGGGGYEVLTPLRLAAAAKSSSIAALSLRSAAMFRAAAGQVAGEVTITA